MKKNKLLIGLGTLMVINLPLLATISCQKTETKVLINKKGALLSQNLFDPNIDINSAKELINNQWILDNKNKLFENPQLLTTTENITNIKTTISGTTIIVSFLVGNESFEFTILNFRNPDFEEVRLSIKSNTVFDKTLFNELKDKQEISEAIKLISEDWLRTNKDTIFDNSHLITDKTSITVKAGINGKIIAIQATIGGVENFNFFIEGFTNSVISGNNKETIVFPLITNDSFNSTWAHEESYTNDQVKAFIESNKNTIFHNLPTSTIVSSVVATYNRMLEGIIDVKVTLSGKIYNQNGELIEANNKEFSIQLIGFKTTGLTTTLKSKELDIKDISDLKDKKASEIKNDENGSNNITLKTKIKDLIQNTFLANQLDESDIEIILDQAKANDAKGTLDVKVKVKNKAWANGVKEEKEFELTLIGFKIQAPTEVVNFEIKDLNRDILKKYYATPYEKINSSTKQDSTTQDKGIKNYLKEELNKKVNNIFKNIPQETKIKTLEINDHSIGSIQNGYDAAHGAVYIVVTLDKYYDENGIEKNNSSSPSSKNDEGKFYFKISGFKVDENINTYLDSALYDPTEWNSINLSSDSQTSYQDETNLTKNIEETKASEWKSNITLIKTKFEEKLHGTNNELQQKNDKKFTNIKNKVYGDEKWASATEVDGEASIEIDQSQTGIHDDVRGTLILEVTFKNLWWKNGVFIKEHKERIRFSGFKNYEANEFDTPTYNPYLSIVEEEIKQKNGTTTKEKIAIINVSEEHGNLDLISWLQQNSLETKATEELDLKQKCENNFKLQMEKSFNDLDSGVLYSPVLETFLVGVKNKIASEDGYNNKWCKVENVSFNVEEEEWKNTTKSSKAPIADSVDFTIKTFDNTKEFKFRMLGFLSKNNAKESENEIKKISNQNNEWTKENTNNDETTKDNFEFKWVSHQYESEDEIKDPQFYGHYWYSLEITIKDDQKQTLSTNSQTFIEKIQKNTKSDFHYTYNDLGLDITPYEIKAPESSLKNDEQKTFTIKFKHETWTSMNKDNSWRQLKNKGYLAIKNLGSFDFSKIFVEEEGGKIDTTINKSIFAAEFVKDNDNEFGYIKIKGYDLPTDIDQYEFTYIDKKAEEKDQNKFNTLALNGNIVDTHNASQLENKNVFVKVKFLLDVLRELEDIEIYVNLKDDSKNKHLVSIFNNILEQE